jgi:hypothetical protein
MGAYVTNIVPRDNEYFDMAVSKIYAMVRKDICREQVRPKYIYDSLRPPRGTSAITHVAILFEGDNAKGFMTLAKDGLNLFIDVICAEPGYGKPMILSVLQWSDASGIRDVELHALPGVLFYYQQYGFNFRKSCADDPVIFSAEDKQQYLAQKILHFDDAERNPVALQYLKMLQEHSINVRNTDDRGNPNCGPSASVEEIASDHCAMDGYLMHRC